LESLDSVLQGRYFKLAPGRTVSFTGRRSGYFEKRWYYVNENKRSAKVSQNICESATIEFKPMSEVFLTSCEGVSDERLDKAWKHFLPLYRKSKGFKPSLF